MSIVFSTAYDGIEELALPAGTTLLIIGVGGGVGIAAAQIALARGITVVGTASASKRAFVSSVGAIHVAYGPGVVGRVRAVTERGVDGIFDFVGGAALRELAGLVKEHSKIITAADAATAEELGGSKVARVRSASVLEACVQLVEKGALSPFVTEVFPFDQAAEAIARVESGHATGKIVVQVS
jgi:NADPH:quinone reductase-like Zn-dependent oxidoreductase